MRRLLITATAGSLVLAGSAWAQSGQHGRSSNAPRYVPCETLLDATVASRTDREHTADIQDLVVDTRNGRAVFAIIDTNELLESSDKTVAIPYGALSWNAGTGQYTIEARADELKNLPECDPEDLVRLQDESWISTLKGIFGNRPELDDLEGMRGDEYTPRFADARTETLNGTIVAISRQTQTARGGDCYAIVVEDADGAERHMVLLAPMGYLTRKSVIPAEGNEVSVTTVKAFNAKGEVVRIARSIRVDGTTLELRDDEGVPAWQAEDGRSRRTFYMLASDIADGSLNAQGEEFGSIDEVVFEANSGTAAFAVISVGGLLGVDDTLYPVPCGALTMIGDHDLFIDMPVSKLKLAPKLSKDGVEDLNNMQFAQSVRDYYGVKAKQFDTDRPTRWMTSGRPAGN